MHNQLSTAWQHRGVISIGVSQYNKGVNISQHVCYSLTLHDRLCLLWHFLFSIFLSFTGVGHLPCPEGDITTFKQLSAKNFTEANKVCHSKGLFLPAVSGAANTQFACIQHEMREFTQHLNQHLHVWLNSCDGPTSCDVLFFDLYHKTGIRDGFRSGVNVADTTYFNVVLCSDGKTT